MKRLLTATVIAALLVAPLVPAGAKKKKSKPKPMVIFKDPAGDAGNQGTPVPGAAEAGYDLVKGQIGQKGRKQLLFTATHSAMPDSGSVGETARLVWGLVVDGEIYQITVKSLDVGKPDVVASALTQSPQGGERVGTVYQGVARLEQCGTEAAPVISFSKCSVLEYYDATFDPAKMTASWAIDMKAVSAKKGSQIAGGGTLADTGCAICWVPHYGERSLTPSSIIDAASPSKIYKVK